MNSEPDTHGHTYGPDAKETYEMVRIFIYNNYYFCFILYSF